MRGNYTGLTSCDSNGELLQFTCFSPATPYMNK